MGNFTNNKKLIAGIIIFLSIIIAALDFILPIGIIIWVLYLVPIALAQLAFKSRNVFLLIGFYSILMFAALIDTATVIPIEYAVFNRTMGIIVVLLASFLLSNIQKSHQKLKQINQRFDIAVKSANTGVWEFDLLNNRNVWDDTMFSLYGIDKQKFNNAFDSWKDMLDPSDKERANQVFTDALKGAGDYQDVFSIIRGDGEKRYIRAYSKIERDQEGKALKAIGINIDITDQKIAGENLQKLNDELLRSNKELENFAYIASHDLQEPLRMITSFSQLLEKRYSDKLDQEAHEFIKFVVDGATHMQHLINDLLDYSRITTQAGILKEVDMNTPVKRAIDNLQMKIEDCHAKITVGDLPVVIGDELHLVRLLQNLVENALKFSKPGNPFVEIACKSDFNAWLFSVKDNGIGMDKKNQDKIFDIFQRLNSREKYPGTGMGLAICKKIVEQHGGKIWVDSEPDNGTTFFFTIKK